MSSSSEPAWIMVSSLGPDWDLVSTPEGSGIAFGDGDVPVLLQNMN